MADKTLLPVIPVERWTFWAGVLLLVAGFFGQVWGGVTFNPDSGESTDPTYALFFIAFILLMVSVALGSSYRSTEETTTSHAVE
ncbi:MAG TPA: hypothetical protein VEG66_01190 [Thermoplasmata archaeon]|jgi:4-hydroxybenzoate polyprenyltransferase|nr:hypothetical protein [Thermoplasmata archaeon]